jgi:acyl-CoA reductase-like NAD-dependent aldehyde dehydrogenase
VRVMPDLKTLLTEGDPVRNEGELSPADASRMRRLIVAATAGPSVARTPWQRPFAIAAVGALVAVVGAIAGHRRIVDPVPATQATEPLAAIGGSSIADERRQLQFATPGGTRIIWIFDQNLRLQESMP